MLNRFFDFTTRQIKFLIVLATVAAVFSLYMFIKAYAFPTERSPTLEVFIGEEETEVTGIFTLDPNLAPADSLELLPGIGRVLADRIIEYRQHNRFENEIDITEVKGIGPKMYEKLKPYLKVTRY
jgi:DNA uptake protein ComE-like DNA-binding protein